MIKRNIGILIGVAAIVCIASVFVFLRSDSGVEPDPSVVRKDLPEEVRDKSEKEKRSESDIDLAAEIEKLRRLEKRAINRGTTGEIKEAREQVKLSRKEYAEALSQDHEMAELRKRILELKSTVQANVSMMSKYGSEIARLNKENRSKMSKRIQEVVKQQQSELETLFEDGKIPESRQEEAAKIRDKYSEELAELRGFISEPPKEIQDRENQLRQSYEKHAADASGARKTLMALSEKLGDLEKELRIKSDPVNAAAGRQYQSMLALKNSLRSDPDVAKQREIVERLRGRKIKQTATNNDDTDSERARLLEQRKALPKEPKQKILSRDEAFAKLKELEERKDT